MSPNINRIAHTLPFYLLLGLASACAAEIHLADHAGFEWVNTKPEDTVYRGKKALKMVEVDAAQQGAMGIVKNLTFHDGTIEADVSGAPSKTADATARGFIGIAFRMQDRNHFEMIYIRPSNARATDQLARNHTLQYLSAPDWPWKRLRDETPGQYESYADMQPGEWTHVRLEIRGTGARLFVGKAEQPCLVIPAMKLGASEGSVALWIGPGTEGYFRDFKITADPASSARK